VGAGVSMAEAGQRVPRPFVLYAVVLGAVGVLAVLFSWLFSAPIVTPVLVLLLAATLIVDSLALEMPSGAIYSLSFPLTMAVAVMFGPAAAGLAAILSSFSIADLRRKKPAAVLAFNAGQIAISACAGAWLYLLLGGQLLVQQSGTTVSYHPLTAAQFPEVLIPLAACAVASVLLNDLLVSYGIHLLYEVPWIRVTSNEVAWMAPSQLVLAAVGFSMAEVLSISAVALVLFVVPLLVSRQVFQRYAGLRDAYLDTIRSLVAAIEAKDPYTRGHSERVTTYAGLLGEALGLSQRELERLEYAAVLHDVGKIGVPAGVLTKPGRLTDEEYTRIKTHPDVGAQIVSRVPYLSDIVEPVLYHHERFDGLGYGLGTSGLAIPRAARVLAVADAFDAMTSARPYRPALSLSAAADELRKCAGTQFDPEMATTFVELIDQGRVVLADASQDGDPGGGE
jgi:HD-GYP domain-containing protein (c-di-GMP phosphodiesterase class II)